MYRLKLPNHFTLKGKRTTYNIYLCYAMNYFEFYDLPESFNPDQALLKKQFYKLSKKYHPDFYANESDERQQEILELSTLNNKAYHTLTDPAKRLDYILRTHNLVSEGAKPQLPSDFLMEMMDINERLMEVKNAEDLANITAEALAVESDLQNSLSSLTTDYETLSDTAKEDRLNKITDIYYRLKYLLRIKESLDTFAARY
jgi:molecular chaperone HscB